MTYDSFICEFYSNQFDELIEAYENRLQKIKEICITENTKNVMREAFDVYTHECEYFVEASKGFFRKIIDGIKKIIESIFKKSEDLDKVDNTKDLKVYTNVKPEDLQKAVDEAATAVKKPKFSKGAKIIAGTIGALVLAKGAFVIATIKKCGGIKAFVQTGKDLDQRKKDIAKYGYSFTEYKKHIASIRKSAEELLVSTEERLKDLDDHPNNSAISDHVEAVKYYKELFKHITSLLKYCDDAIPDGKILSKEEAINVQKKFQSQSDIIHDTALKADSSYGLAKLIHTGKNPDVDQDVDRLRALGNISVDVKGLKDDIDRKR